MKKTFLKLTNITILISFVVSNWLSIIPAPKIFAASTDGGYQVIDQGDYVQDPNLRMIEGDGKTFYITYDYLKGDGLLDALDNTTKDLVRAGYDGRIKIETFGTDKANISKWLDIQKALEGNITEATKHAKNPWYIPKEYSKVPIPDQKIIDTLYTITDPKILGGYDNWPVSLNRINKGHLCDKDHCKATDESALTVDPNQRTQSHHAGDITQAADWDTNGQIKCTRVTCDDEDDPNNGHNGDNNDRCDKKNSKGYDETTNQTRPEALKPTNIEFKDLLQDKEKNGSGGSEVGTSNNPTTLLGTGSSITELFKKSGQEATYSFLARVAETSGIDDPQQAISKSADKLPGNPIPFASIIGLNTFLHETGHTNVVDYFPATFKDFVDLDGRQIVAKEIFDGKLDPNTFEGEDGYQWLGNTGARTLEKNIGLPNYSLLLGDSNTLNTIGQRVMEDILGLIPGTLKSVAANLDQLVRQIGQGYMEKNLYLSQGSLSANNLDGIKNQIGSDKYDQIFTTRNAQIVASALQIDVNVYNNNLANFGELKRLVGEKVLDQNIRIYEQYVIKDEQDKEIARLDSRDEMLNLLNYKKPEIDFAKNTITTYNHVTRETSEIPFNYNPIDPNSYTYTYEKILSNTEEQFSLTRKFLKGDSLSEVYQSIGAIRTAKGLSSVVEEQLDIYQFLLTGNIPKQTVKYNDQISSQINAFDPQEVAGRVGLHDWYDLYKIFIKNRGYEVYPYYGMEILSNTLNPKSDASGLTQTLDSLSSGSALDQQTQFIKNKLDQIKERTKEFTNQGVINDIIVHIDNASKELNINNNDNLTDVVSNPPQKKVASSLKNIGQIIWQNNLSDTSEAKQIFRYIYEINYGSELNNYLPDVSILNHSINYGIDDNYLSNFFSQDLNNININQLVIKAASGSLLYAMDMNKEYSEAESELNSILNSNDNPVNALVNGFGRENFANLAETLNISLTLTNDTKLSSQEIAQIFNGDWITVLRKIANKPISDGLGVSFIDLISNGSLVQQIPDAVFSYANIADSQISTIRDMLTSISSGNFISQSIDVGFNSLFSLMDTSQITSFPEANGILDKFKDLFKKGLQTTPMIKEIQALSGKIGEFIPKALISGDLSSALKELGALNLFKSLNGEGIDLNAARIFSGLKLPDLSQINDWVTKQFGDLGDKLGSLYGELNKMGLTELIKSNGQNINYAYIDNIIKTQIDPNVPSGFARAMLSGDQSSLLSVSAEWIKNSIKNPTEAEKTAIDALSNVLAGNMSASSITSASMDIIFSNKSFKTSLENAGISQDSFRSLVSSIASGNLDKGSAINIGKQIILNNMVNNGADAKNIAAVSGALDLLNGDITPQRGLSAVMAYLNQDENFKNSLENAGLTPESVQALISTVMDGNFTIESAAQTAKGMILASMKNKNTSAEDMGKVSGLFDLISSGGSKESIASAVTTYINNDKKIQESLKNAGISSNTISSLISAATSGNIDQGQITSIAKEMAVNNLRNQLKNETDPTKIKTGEQNIAIVESAFDILNGNASPESIVSTGLGIIEKNKDFTKGLEKAGISTGSFNNLISAAVRGNITQADAVSVLSGVILNKVEGVQNKQIASQILNVLGSGGNFDANTITSIITTAYGDKIDAMFKGMNIAPGGGAQILSAMASGNIQAAAGAIIGAQLDRALTSAMDNLTETATGTTEAIRNANILAGESEMKQMESLDNGNKTDFFNFEKMGEMITNAAFEMVKSMATAYAASLLAQATGMDEETAKALTDSLVLILTGTNPALVIASLAHDFLHVSIPGLSFLGLGGGGGKIIKEVYCAMDYYPWLQDDYPQFKPDEIYKGIYYWPNVEETVVDSGISTGDSYSGSSIRTVITPGDKNEKGFSQEVVKPNRVGENLPGRPPYEFKAKPGDWQKIVQKKLPAAAYMKMTQTIFDFTDLPVHFNDEEMKPAMVMVPLWPKTLIEVTDEKIKANQSNPDIYEGIGGEILNKFMHPLDLVYGVRVVDSDANETDKIEPGYTMKERLKSEDSKQGFWLNKDIYHWVHLTW